MTTYREVKKEITPAITRAATRAGFNIHITRDSSYMKIKLTGDYFDELLRKNEMEKADILSCFNFDFMNQNKSRLTPDQLELLKRVAPIIKIVDRKWCWLLACEKQQSHQSKEMTQ